MGASDNNPHIRQLLFCVLNRLEGGVVIDCRHVDPDKIGLLLF